MLRLIPKNFHRPLQLLPAFLKPFGFLFMGKEYSVRRIVKFTKSCEYTLDETHQYDWNKLFGVCFGMTGIHKNSIRFGWRWNPKKNKIEICTIEYRDGIPTREIMQNCDIAIGEERDLEIKFNMSPDGYVWYSFLNDGSDYCGGYLQNVSAICYFGCGLYFGGKKRAPKSICVDIEKY